MPVVGAIRTAAGLLHRPATQPSHRPA